MPDVRYVMPWDASERTASRSELDSYMYWARQVGARVMVTFGASRRRGQELKAPSRLQFIREFRALRRRYPGLRVPDLERGQPRHPAGLEQAGPGGALLRLDAPHLPRVHGVGPAVLDAPNMTSWILRFKRAARYPVRIWSVHNHIDANRHRA